MVNDDIAHGIHGEGLTTALELPSVDRAARHTKLNASMVDHIRRLDQNGCVFEIGRGAYDDMLLLTTNRNSDHIIRNQLSKPDAAVEPSLCNIDQPTVGHNFETHIRVGRQKAREQRHQNLLGRVGVRIDPKQARRGSVHVPKFLDCLAYFADRGHQPRRKTSAGLGQGYVSCRSMEEFDFKSAFKARNGMTEGRCALIERPRRRSKSPVLRNSKEGCKLAGRQ